MVGKRSSAVSLSRAAQWLFCLKEVSYRTESGQSMTVSGLGEVADIQPVTGLVVDSLDGAGR